MEQALLLFLKDLPRSGTPAKFTEAQKKQIVALACDKPILIGEGKSFFNVKKEEPWK
jgi:hypothetical protein